MGQKGELYDMSSQLYNVRAKMNWIGWKWKKN